MEKNSLTQKILKSQLHGQKLWGRYEIRLLPIQDIWISVPQTVKLRGKPFFEKLTLSIQEEGLHFPLLVSNPTRTELKRKKKQYKERMMPLPDWQDGRDDETRLWVVWGGSQRIRVAKNLGYTQIDCAIIPTLDEARGLQSKMRNPYQGNLY